MRRVIPWVLVVAAGAALVWWLWLRPHPGPPAPARPTTSAAPSRTATPATPMFDQARSDAKRLPVKGWDRQVDFRRSAFGEAWSDDVNVEFGHNGCNTRDDVLRRDLAQLVVRPGTCFAQSGSLHDPYSGQTIAFVRGPNTSEAVQIDHVVSLSDAWYKGARLWDDQRRRDFANDPRNLLAVGGKANFDKAFRDAASWLPSNAAFHCAFVARVVDVKTAHNLAVCMVESLRGAKPIEPDDADEADIAMRQLTSGSTGAPKAIEISHANLAAHSVAMCDALDMDIDNDVLASWLPLSHDMGMIAFVQLPMQVGLETVVVTTDQFLRRPLAWAELISKHRATFTSGPNFAYSVLARALQRASPTDIDLSSLRLAVNGAEPINHRDLVNFATVGARFGLRPSAPTPAYGLAEATLMVSTVAPQDEAIVDSISRQAVMAGNRAQPVPDDSEDVEHIVCVGFAAPGMDVRIVRDGTAQEPREIGAIELRGPAVAGSYLTSGGVFPLARPDGWVDTGDLGYFDEEGRIYVCGRTKDLIVVAGTNLYPHDIERAAETVDGVRKGCVIAVRVDAEREGFAVLAEVHDADQQDTRVRISRDIIARVNRQVGHAPREVRLLPARALPKTASGKVRRNDARKLLSQETHSADTTRPDSRTEAEPVAFVDSGKLA